MGRRQTAMRPCKPHGHGYVVPGENGVEGGKQVNADRRTKWPRGLSLKSLDLTTIRPIFDPLQGLEKDAGRQFGPTRRHVTRPTGRS